MAIVKMNKFVLFAFQPKKGKLLEELQKLGSIQFINLQDEIDYNNVEGIKALKKDNISTEYSVCEEKLSKLKFSIQFLKNYIKPKSAIKLLKDGKKEMTLFQLKESVEASEWEKDYEKLKTYEQQLTTINSEITKVKGEIEEITPWASLDVSFEELKSGKYHFLSAGIVSKQLESTLLENIEKEIKGAYFEVVHSNSKNSFILFISHISAKDKSTEILKKYGFSELAAKYKGTAENVLLELQKKSEVLNEEKAEIVESIKAVGGNEFIFESAYEYYSNILLRLEASKNFLNTESTVAIYGWNAVEENDQLNKVICNVLGEDYYLSFEEAKEEENEAVPIKLKNNDFVSSFESITEMYSMPKYNEIDPTPLLAPFYFIFFGMMVADVGYGLIVLIASALALRLFNLDEKQKRMGKFFFYLSFSTMAFGAVFGSYFGDAIAIPGLLNQTRDIMTIMLISMAMGIVHVFFGLFIKAYMLIKGGDILGAFYDVGSWIITLVGVGMFLAGGALGITPEVKNIFKYMMILGAVLIVVTQGRHVKNVGARIGAGLYALYGISSYVGDLVSYTRLMALGLAGGALANSFNLIVRMIPGVLGTFIIGPIFFVLFHIFNLLLGLLGAYVHTCRLQYVEFFTKFYEGGGRNFTPFGMLNKYLNIRRD